MPNDIIRLGIIGCGEVTQVIHIPTLRHMPDSFAITALCDVSPKVRAGVAAVNGISRTFSDHQSLLACADIDAVLIANPHVLHAETALAAMQAGKHVLIEKPICVTLAEADALIAAAAACRRTVQVGYMRRHAPAFTAAKARLAGRTDIRLARVHDVLGRNALIVGPTSTVIRPSDLPASLGDQLAASLASRITDAIGPAGEPLRNAYALMLGLSSHDISAMRELFGMPERVLYAAARGADGRVISAAFDYGGFVCQFETCIDAIPRFDAHIEVYLPAEVLRVEYDTPYVRNLPGRLISTDVDEHGHPRTQTLSSWRDAFTQEWQAFHTAIRTGARPKTGPADARDDLVIFAEMIAAMRR